ncbi:hypothetical protein B0H63DRAFT_469628, partial [Podospora didyma]
MVEQQQPPSLTAVYTSGTSGNAPFTITTALPPVPTTTTDDNKSKTQYLLSVREAVIKLQEHVNKELTARMEEDNKKAQAAGAKPIADEKEEKNYGEEVVEED